MMSTRFLLTLAMVCLVFLHEADGRDLKDKVLKAADDITCDVCKEVVADVWEKSVARKERGDETDEERLETFINSKCTSQGLEDDYTVDEDQENNKFTFRGKNMKDYEAEGGVVTETTRPDGTVEQHMEMKQTVTSEVNSATGTKRAIDPKTWIGIAIQEACRSAVIKNSGGSRMAELVFKKFWPEEDEEVDEEVTKHAASEETLTKHVCKDIAKVCSTKKLIREL